MKEYVVGYLFNHDLSQVVMIEKTRPVEQVGKLNGVGGKIEPGETPEEAVIREFREETGVGTSHAMWSLFATVQSFPHPNRDVPIEKIWFFKARSQLVGTYQTVVDGKTLEVEDVMPIPAGTDPAKFTMFGVGPPDPLLPMPKIESVLKQGSLQDLHFDAVRTVTEETIVKVKVAALPNNTYHSSRWMIPLALDAQVLAPSGFFVL